MRQPITLKIKFKSASLDQFIERYSVDVSRGGIFIRTKEPLQVGTQLKFEFQLQDASALISGEGTVVWIRAHDPSRTGVAPGMGVRFDKVAPASGQVLEQILAEKTRRGEAAVESRFDAGVRASSAVSGTVATKRTSDFDAVDSKALTPLPKNMPGLEGAEEEFGDESTRVMQDDVVQRLAEKTRDEDKRGEAFSDEPTRARSSEEIDHLIRSTGPIAVGDDSALDRTNVDEKTLPPLPGQAAKPAASVIASTPALPSVVVAPNPPPMATPAQSPSPSASVADSLPPPPSLGDAPPPPVTGPAAVGVGSIGKVSAEGAASGAGAGSAGPGAASGMSPGANAISEHGISGERPPQRKKSSPLPAILGIGVIGALAVGYLVFSGPQPVPAVPGDKPSVAVAPPVEPTPTPGNPEPTAPPVTPVASPTPEPQPAPEVKAGPVIAVSSEPAGATVLVDGKAQAAVTPTALSGLDPKKSYEVQLTLKGYRDWKGKLVPKEGAKLEAKLVANEKVVEVSSTPAGADLFLDGRKLGRTPFTIRKLDGSKEHQVELRHGGFVTQTRSIGTSEDWESKTDGRDVLALALTLEAEPKVAPHPVVVKRPVMVKKPDAPERVTPEPVGPVATPDTAEKPVVEKPAVEKPAVEKPAVEKPVEKPADTEDKTPKAPAATKVKAADKVEPTAGEGEAK